MQAKKLMPLIVITALVVITAAWIAGQRAPETEVESSPLFPELLNSVDQVKRITIRDADNHTEIHASGDAWVLTNRDNYPATLEQVRQLVVSLSRLMVLEGKTSNPERYSRLEVEGTAEAPGQSTLVTLADESGQPLAALIAGKARSSSNPAAPVKPSLYVRRAGEEQALLVEGVIEAPADPMDWIVNDLFAVASARIAEITISHPDDSESIHLQREPKAEDAENDNDFVLNGIPAGKALKSQVSLNGLGTALEDLRLRDVAAHRETVDSPVQASYQTFDGLKVDIRLDTRELDGNKQHFAHFTVSTAADASAAVIEEAAKLGERLQDWDYAMPEFKVQMMTRKRSELLRDADSE